MMPETNIKIKGPVIDVNLMPDKLVVEFPTYRINIVARDELPACGIYVIWYEEIADVRIEGSEVVLKLTDGSEVKLEVYAPELLYRELMKRLEEYREWVRKFRESRR